ncbi:MAG TPA: DUF4920 domain-containing protein [Polyangiaceae bacterium]|nr:DUF4920 domain-containing protein [Polyangiaceae bacterium]
MRAFSPSAILVALTALSLGCARPSGDAPTPSASASSAAGAAGTLLLGERITSAVVPLADIARDPSRFANRTVATTGKVTAVCQEMGCWMEIRDEVGQAHIRMHGHSFFVPKTASGHVARVQATVVKGSDEECAEKGPASTLAKVELDATGVELD